MRKKLTASTSAYWKTDERKTYRDPSYKTPTGCRSTINTRYIASAVAISTGNNYNALVNHLRLRDACRMMQSDRYNHMTVEEIGLLAGFSSRQAFYLAFHRLYKETPREYRLKVQ
ncbi:MAG: helix-turn-helix domain-containing protein [Prevotellamassilia sp.]